MTMEKREQWEGGYCAFESSHDGTGVFRVHLNRTNRAGRREFRVLKVTMRRSNIRCIYNALKAFADKEREAVEGLPV